MTDPTTPPEISAAKLNAVTGKGLRRAEAPTVLQESGEEIVLKNGEHDIPCKYCGALPCRGPSWIFEGQLRFKCNSCGRKQKLGNTQDLADQNKANVESIQAARVNRDRVWRDIDAKHEEERLRKLDDMAVNPDRHSSAMLDPQFVNQKFFQ